MITECKLNEFVEWCYDNVRLVWICLSP